jgi:hypothetical protein
MQLNLSREEQTAISRMKSGHLKMMRFVNGEKEFPDCPKCNGGKASAGHILQCMGLPSDAPYKCPVAVVEQLKLFNFMEIV